VREQFTSLLAAHLSVNVILAPLLAPLEDDWATSVGELAQHPTSARYYSIGVVGMRCAGVTACVAQYLQTLCKEDALMYYKEGFTELFYTKGRCYTALSIAALPIVPATCPLCERTLLRRTADFLVSHLSVYHAFEGSIKNLRNKLMSTWKTRGSRSCAAVPVPALEDKIGIPVSKDDKIVSPLLRQLRSVRDSLA